MNDRVIIGDATLYLGDCREVLPALQPVDAVVTDPPYNNGKQYGIHCDDALESSIYITWLASIFHALPTGNLIYTPGDRHLWDTPRIMQIAGFKLARPLAWHKKEFAGDLWTGGPAICWEPIIWAYRENEKAFNKLFGASGRDCLVVNSTHGNPFKKEHPCPKPIQVCIWLVALFVPIGGTCLDPFMGTGTTGVACHQLGRRFVGIEVEPKHFDTACRRIDDEQRQGRLFSEAELAPRRGRADRDLFHTEAEPAGASDGTASSYALP